MVRECKIIIIIILHQNLLYKGGNSIFYVDIN